MSKRAVFMVTVAGTNITAPLIPVLISLTISDKVGTHSDTATLDIDDTDGRIILPELGAAVVVALGWEGSGVRIVFLGTVDEVKSSGSRNGRTISISAKGVDTTGKPKEAQQRHFDERTVEDILKEAGSFAGITEIEVDPSLASIRRTYFEMRDESFIHMGERLAREIGGNFRIQGTKAMMSKRGGMRRPQGATIDEIVSATGWQSHTTRGPMAGALKKKLGLTITSEKNESRGRVYRVV